MIYAMVDVRRRRVLDVFESGDRKLLMKELTDLYNRTTGESVSTFATVEEARARVVDALSKRYFPAAASKRTAAEVGAPASKPAEQAALGPVARARMVFNELKGRPRKEHIEACAKLGIKRSTAAAQYQAWKTKQASGAPQ